MMYSACMRARLHGIFCSLAMFAILSPAIGEEMDRASALRQESLPTRYQRLKKLANPLPAPGPNDWLAQYREPGRGVREYIAAGPVRRTDKLTTVYLLPIGEFTPEQEQIVALTAEYLSLFFATPVKTQARLPLAKIPAHARREHPSWGWSRF